MATKRLLSVRETARLLGVHENTIRNWDRAGLIRAVRLPSGFRRFQREEVDRLRAQMYAQVDQGARKRDVRPNVPAEELRLGYLSSSPVERLREAADLSLAATTLARYGARSHRPGSDVG